MSSVFYVFYVHTVYIKKSIRHWTGWVVNPDPGKDPYLLRCYRSGSRSGLKNDLQISKKRKKTSPKMLFLTFFLMKTTIKIKEVSKLFFFQLWHYEPQFPDTDPKLLEVLDPNPDPILYTMNTDLKPCFGFWVTCNLRNTQPLRTLNKALYEVVEHWLTLRFFYEYKCSLGEY